MFRVKQWSNFIVPSVKTCTLQNLPVITTPMVRISALDSPTCFSWFIPNTDLNGQPISLFQGQFLLCANVKHLFMEANRYILVTISFFYTHRLYGFKIHPLAYQLQYQAASNFKAPTMRMNYNGGKR